MKAETSTKKADAANTITPEMLRSWGPCSEGYKRFCELFPEGVDLITAIDGLIKDEHERWAYWLFCAARDRELFPEVTLRGYRNSGDRNSGDLNSGDRNSGDLNSGDRNSGDRNSGDRNSGDQNSGYRNSGYLNSGDLNSGDRNSGDRNSGDLNSGDLNSGDQNSGGWNKGSHHTGFFNTGKGSLIVFNKRCNHEVWDNAYKPVFLFFDMNTWVDESEMSDAEKEANPSYKITGGYLKRTSYEEAFKASWDAANKEDRMRVRDLPNFDAKVFKEISGIDVDAE